MNRFQSSGASYRDALQRRFCRLRLDLYMDESVPGV